MIFLRYLSFFCFLPFYRPLSNFYIAWYITFWYISLYLLFPLLKLCVSHLVIPWSWHTLCKWSFFCLIINKRVHISSHNLKQNLRPAWILLRIFHRRYIYYSALVFSPFCVVIFNIICVLCVWALVLFLVCA
jgi:hypothetical protein